MADANARLASFVDRHVDCVFEVDGRGTLRAGNANASALTGYAAAELIGRPIADLVPEEQLPIVLRHLQRVFEGETVEYHSTLVRRDGRRVPVRVSALPVVVGDAVTSTYAIVRDITIERSTTTELIEYTDRIRTLNAVAGSSGGLAASQIADVLECGAQLLGFDCGVITQISDTTLEATYVFGPSGIAAGTTFALERTYSATTLGRQQPLLVADLNESPWNEHPARRFMPWQSYVGSGYAVAGAPYGTVAFGGLRPRAVPFGRYDADLVESIATMVGFNVERAINERHLNALAFHDPLTGLANRTLFDETLVGRIASARRTGASFAVHYLDLDRFKAINDSLGHAAGDEVLRIVARRLDRAVRENDTIARLGGDEFVTIQDGIAHPIEAARFASRIVSALKRPMRVEAATCDVGGSVGIALYPQDGADAPSLVRRADAALYQAKRSGGGTARFANDADNAHVAALAASATVRDERRRLVPSDHPAFVGGVR
ncbi:MAG: hypothetical protein NVS3B17_09380 [Vulcanimicrobiaceae bacterium]